MTFKDWFNNKKGVLNISELSRKLDIDEMIITKLLNGELMPTITDIIKIWLAFKLENNELLELISVVADNLEISFSNVFDELVSELVILTEGEISLKRNL